MRETLATILWEGWTALVLCAAAVFLPGSEALTYPAVLWPGLVLAAAVPTGWAFCISAIKKWYDAKNKNPHAGWHRGFVRQSIT